MKKGKDIFHTLAFRLTMLYAILFALLSFVVFGVVYVTLSSDLKARMDASLVDEIREFDALYKTKGIGGLKDEFKREAKSQGVNRVFFRLLSPSMDVLASSDTKLWGKIGLRQPVLKNLKYNNEIFMTIPHENHHYKVRVVYKKTHDNNILQVGHTLRGNIVIMESYREIFGTAMLTTLVFSILIGWFVAKHGMKGVERVTETALRIGRGNLDHRVPLGGEGTEIDNLATAFNDMLERIQILIRELREVTDNIAHDMRTPLTRIRGMAETTLLASQNIDEFRDMASTVVEESDRLISMINTMLKISKVNSGLYEASKEKADIKKVVEDAYDLFLTLAEDRGLDVRIQVPEDSLYVPCKISDIQRVVANLIDNAIKFTPEGGLVSIYAGSINGNALITVTDTGIGISGEDLPHIFERFYRGEKTRTTPGNGLGLSLAKAIVESYGGKISVDSTANKGSTFTVHIPM